MERGDIQVKQDMTWLEEVLEEKRSEPNRILH
jgi:hypothetical protein